MIPADATRNLGRRRRELKGPNAALPSPLKAA
jgi:hypothetical protein